VSTKKIGPRWWSSKNSYFAFINGKPKNLGPDQLKAWQQYHTLSLAAMQPQAPTQTCAALASAFLAYSQLNTRPETYRGRLVSLRAFTKTFGDRNAADITLQDIVEWLRTKQWGPGTRRRRLEDVKQCFKYGKCPIEGLRIGKPTQRGIECLITDEQHAVLIAAAHPALRQVLIALDQTGARPGYIITGTAAELHNDLWVLPPQPGRKLSKVLTILLSSGMQELCHQLGVTHPLGPIFRTTKGQVWQAKELSTQFRRLRNKLSFPKAMCCYSYRHRFATRWIKCGGSLLYLARIQGTSVRMIESTYAHLLTSDLRVEFDRIMINPVPSHSSHTSS